MVHYLAESVEAAHVTWREAAVLIAVAEAEANPKYEDIGSLERVLDRAEPVEGLNAGKEESDSETTPAETEGTPAETENWGSLAMEDDVE